MVLIWDLAHGILAARLAAHHDTLYSFCFSRDSTILATGGSDDCINLWDFKRLLHEMDLEEISSSRAPIVRCVFIPLTFCWCIRKLIIF